jgi:ABC-type antimicrobial peptide transport system permease subunit
LFHSFKNADQVKDSYISININSEHDTLTRYKTQQLINRLQSNDSRYIHEYIVQQEFQSVYLDQSNKLIPIKNSFVDASFFSKPVIHESSTNYIEIVSILHGRNFDLLEVNHKVNVALISESTSLRLFPSVQESIGKEIKVNIRDDIVKFIVIGVVNDFSYRKSQFNSSDQIIPLEFYLPFSWYKEVSNQESINVNRYVVYESNNPKEINDLIQLQNIENAQTTYLYKYFANVTRNRYMEQYMQILGMIAFVSSVSIYSMFVVIVNYRKEEIGIKQAIGASKKDIFKEFFVETFIIMSLCFVLALAISLSLISWYIIVKRSEIFDMSIYVRTETVFLICGFVLLLISSISAILAYQATNVGIVDSIRNI